MKGSVRSWAGRKRGLLTWHWGLAPGQPGSSSWPWGRGRRKHRRRPLAGGATAVPALPQRRIPPRAGAGAVQLPAVLRDRCRDTLCPPGGPYLSPTVPSRWTLRGGAGRSRHVAVFGQALWRPHCMTPISTLVLTNPKPPNPLPQLSNPKPALWPRLLGCSSDVVVSLQVFSRTFAVSTSVPPLIGQYSYDSNS